MTPAPSVTATPAESAAVAPATVTAVPEASGEETVTSAPAAESGEAISTVDAAPVAPVVDQASRHPAPSRRSRRAARSADHGSADRASVAPAALAAAIPAVIATADTVRLTIADDASTAGARAEGAAFRLLEPPVGHSVAEEPVDQVPVDAGGPSAAPADAADAPERDEFEAAARLFSFTGELPVQAAADSDDVPDAASEPDIAAHVAAGRGRAPRGASFKRVAAASFSISVMGIVGLLTVATTTPAEAVAAATGAAPAALSTAAPGSTDLSIDPDEIQAYVAPPTTENAEIARSENYSMVTMADLAAASGIQNFSNFFVNDPTAAIQWPFAVGVPISYGFGMRSGRMHEGVDFTPGAGSPIQAIADGTVRVATESGGAYGVHVIIDHEVDGQMVSSHYAHMQYGSLEVEPGQQITVGTVLGKTGNTGRSFGAHTHFELLLNGTTPIDPLPWLREHAGG